jgi:drug/metabolite transporter (DMT)-like permease
MRAGGVAAHAAAFWAAVLFGASLVATRIVLYEVPPVSLAALRFGQGGVLLGLVLVAAAPGLLYVRRRDLPLLLGLGALLCAASPAAMDAGLRLTTLSRGSLALATMPLWSAVLARVVHGETLDTRRVAGIVLTILGVGVVLTDRGLSWEETARMVAGDGLMLVTALCAAFYSVLAPLALRRYAPATVTVYAMLLGTLILLPGALAEGLPDAAALNEVGIVLILFLGILGGALGSLLLTLSLTRLSPAQATVYVNVNPILSAVLAWFLLHEQLTGAFAAGSAVVLCGLMLAGGPEGRGARPAVLPSPAARAPRPAAPPGR